VASKSQLRRRTYGVSPIVGLGLAARARAVIVFRFGLVEVGQLSIFPADSIDEEASVSDVEVNLRSLSAGFSGCPPGQAGENRGVAATR